MGRERKKRNARGRTFWDFLIALGSGLTNLLKIEKIICVIILYLIGRDVYFAFNIDKGEIYRENIIDANGIIELLVENGDYIDMLYLAIIAVLAVTILILVIIIKYVYAREIHRLSMERSRLIHDIRTDNYIPLKDHRSSDDKSKEERK